MFIIVMKYICLMTGIIFDMYELEQRQKLDLLKVVQYKYKFIKTLRKDNNGKKSDAIFFLF